MLTRSLSVACYLCLIYILGLISCQGAASAPDEHLDETRDLPEEIKVQLPLPPASAQYTIEHDFFSTAKNLQDLDGILSPALTQAGFDKGEKLRYFVTVDRSGKINGYAIFTFLEVIGEQGNRLEWYSDDDTGSFWEFNLKKLLARLTFSDHEYFRFFVFLVTDETRVTSPALSAPSQEEMMLKYQHGLNSFRDLTRLAPAVASMSVTNDTDCTVLVYEFVNKQASGTTEQTKPIRLAGKQHLQQSGLNRLVNGK